MLNEVKVLFLGRICKKSNTILSVFFATTWIVSCGLKPVPPPEGRFCDIWHKPVECVELDFRKGIADLGLGKIPMQMKSVVIYNVEIENKQNALVEVLHEHRVRVTLPGKEPRMYIKIKDKEDRKRRWEKAKEEWDEFFKSNDP
ncbi:hypothetical protein CH370_03530 [Leptospira kmetyi]|uniref:LIC12806 family lipoprotein n=1 Tax=Leptospira kmetyi TaxID=408139 RepID=UPI000C2B2BB8|nr:hypothetical protein [Leptospira kmetyi]PJZ43502.1 hypothetical protein CH370_03530 [Leptospira kmetyi]